MFCYAYDEEIEKWIGGRKKTGFINYTLLRDSYKKSEGKWQTMAYFEYGFEKSSYKEKLASFARIEDHYIERGSDRYLRCKYFQSFNNIITFDK